MPNRARGTINPLFSREKGVTSPALALNSLDYLCIDIGNGTLQMTALASLYVYHHSNKLIEAYQT